MESVLKKTLSINVDENSTVESPPPRVKFAAFVRSKIIENKTEISLKSSENISNDNGLDDSGLKESAMSESGLNESKLISPYLRGKSMTTSSNIISSSDGSSEITESTNHAWFNSTASMKFAHRINILSPRNTPKSSSTSNAAVLLSPRHFDSFLMTPHFSGKYNFPVTSSINYF